MNYIIHSGVKGQKWGVRRYQNEDGSYTIPVEFVDRWQRQIDTFYEDLSEKERYSDKELAKEILQVIKDEEDSW
jgi:hypothetical protein